MSEAPKLSTGDIFKWNGKFYRVNNVWTTKEGISARLTNAKRVNDRKAREENLNVIDEGLFAEPETPLELKSGEYYRLKMPEEREENPDYARCRYILGVFDNTISFVEIWKSGNHSGSFERSESHANFKKFLSKSFKISKREYHLLYRSCFREDDLD